MTRAQWLAGPIPSDVAAALDRLERTADVMAVAVMPDVHLASDVCVGTVAGARSRLIPSAVGKDIGCGVAAIAVDVLADRLSRGREAAAVLRGLYERIPILRHPRAIPELPAALADSRLSTDSLEHCKQREAPLQLGTVGRGNHFVELQRDEHGGLWVMVHSGSRGIGQAIAEHHLRAAEPDPVTRIATLAADEEPGHAYIADVAWARAYARENRRALLGAVADVLADVLGAGLVADTHVDTDHDHVGCERHGGEDLWVHRKGAQSAGAGEHGLIPGSMGTASFHVEGRGCESALRSSSHGAGRAMSRSEARRRITRRQLGTDTEGVWFDHRLLDRLREEGPRAYKNIDAVMRAQQELVKIVRRLEPVLVFKGA